MSYFIFCLSGEVRSREKHTNGKIANKKAQISFSPSLILLRLVIITTNSTTLQIKAVSSSGRKYNQTFVFFKRRQNTFVFFELILMYILCSNSLTMIF